LILTFSHHQKNVPDNTPVHAKHTIFHEEIQKLSFAFSHPDFTVGFGFSPNPPSYYS